MGNRIVICGSMKFASQMIEVMNQLEELGLEAVGPLQVKGYANGEITYVNNEDAQHKIDNDVIRDHWNKINDADAILVLNYDKGEIANYIGGNSLLEIGFAYVLDKPIYLLNDVPEIGYSSEIVAMKPIVIDGDLSLIKEEVGGS